MTEKEPTIKLAPCDKVDELEEWVDKVLDILGHPEALVTDQSCLWDFSPEAEEIQPWLDALSSKFGCTVYRNTGIVDIAFQLQRQIEANEFYVTQLDFVEMVGDCIATCISCFGGAQGHGCVCGKRKMSMDYGAIQKAKKEIL